MNGAHIPLHLTVNAAGNLSLWDNKSQAERGKHASEVYVKLVLNIRQSRSLMRAWAKAKDINKPKESE